MNRVKFVGDDTYEFIKSLENDLAFKVFGLLEILDELGIHLGPPKLKKITTEIYELRIVGKISVRILCTFSGDNIYILHGFIKKTHKLPKKELEIAISRLKYLR